MNRLNEIEARANAATEGPWEAHGSLITSLTGPGGEVAEASGQDTEFIAHSRTDVPDMAAALRAVLDLHAPDYTYPDCPKCAECSDLASTEARRFVVLWPCPTVAEIHHCLGDDK